MFVANYEAKCKLTIYWSLLRLLHDPSYTVFITICWISLCEAHLSSNTRVPSAFDALAVIYSVNEYVYIIHCVAL